MISSTFSISTSISFVGISPLDSTKVLFAIPGKYSNKGLEKFREYCKENNLVVAFSKGDCTDYEFLEDELECQRECGTVYIYYTE